MATDPVCRMQVEEDKAGATMSHNGKLYYFCSQGCKEKFEKYAERYLAALKPGKNGPAH